ncbi:MAG: hypothetical protein Kow0098_07490 [Ignavibacteriaceae bacterium]
MKRLILSAILLITFSLNAQSDAENLLNKLREKFDNINDLVVNFSQFAGSQSLSGKLYYSDKDKLRVELGNTVLISDGITNWNYNKSENKVIISASNQSDGSAISLKTLLYDYPERCSLKSETDSGQEVLLLIPEDGSLNFRSARLWVNDQNLIDKVLLEDNFGNSTSIKFGGYLMNTGIKDYIFTFQKPEGCTVIDLR